MIFMQEFCMWWYNNIFDPYGRFVFVENLGWATIVTAVVVTILLGVFYKPGDPFYFGHFMEHYGFPALIIVLCAAGLPLFSVLLMLVMPAILLLAVGLGLAMLMYLGIRRMRKAYEEHLSNQIIRLDKERMEEE